MTDKRNRASMGRGLSALLGEMVVEAPIKPGALLPWGWS